MTNLISRTVLLFAFATILPACGGDETAETAAQSATISADGVLRYIPADSPYVIAVTGQTPDDVYDKIAPQIDATLKLYPAVIKSVVSTMIEEAEDGEDTAAMEAALPMIDEFSTVLSLDGLEDAGIGRSSEFALYGAGLLPVMRVTLTDGALMEATIERIESSSADSMDLGTIDNVEYRYAGDDEARIILAVIDDNLVITFAPTVLSEDGLRSLLGLSLPATNIVASGKLQGIADKYGFIDYGMGFVDIEQIASTFLDEQDGINAELLALGNYTGDEMSDVCRAETRSIAGVMPRMVFGYTEISVTELTSMAVMEMRSDIATGMTGLTGPVPGLADKQGGAFSMGMSIDLLALREFYAARLDALEAEPYLCEEFADVQDSVAAGRAVLNQPVPPIVYGFKGFLAVVDDIQGMDMATQTPPTSIDMRLLVSMENAEGLLAMGAMFSPELGALQIEPNGEPVRLEMAQIAALGQIVHLAMTNSSLALSVGDGPEARLPGMLEADVVDPSPFMTIDMDAARYYSFMNEAMAFSDDMSEAPDLQEPIAKMMTAIEETVSRMWMSIDFTENGVELTSTVTLAD